MQPGRTDRGSSYALPATLLAVGGLGLATQFSSPITHLTNAVPRRYAAG
jgi:hypothetical protein